MGLFTKDIKTLNDLFVHTLKDIYYAEQQIAKNLPDMIEEGDRPRPQERLTDASVRNQGPDHASRKGLPDARRGGPGDRLPGDRWHPRGGERRRRRRRQAGARRGIDRGAQAVEHYEITRYGALIAWAKKLGRDDCASVLQQNLDEEKATDEKLNTMALRSVNEKAA
jgi:ferritin-like metal-binding protein YciE